MANAPDSLVLTSPLFQTVDSSDLLVTPTGGTQSSLAAAMVTANNSFASYYFTGTPAATDQVFYVATRAVKILGITEVHAVAAGGTSTLTVIKDTGTSAPGTGTVVQSGSFNLNATANTVQPATLAAAATVTLASGDRLAVKWANAIQSTAGLVVTVQLTSV